MSEIVTTVIRRHYMLTMQLDLSNLDIAYTRSQAQRLQDRDLVLSTLYQEQELNPHAIRQAYACHNECRKQQPPIELRQEPIAFDRWLTAFAQGTNASPELYFLARHKQQYIAVCLFEPHQQVADTLISGFTGVLPAWTGQGVAKAVKAQCLLWAKERGYQYVETSNLVVNRRICALNRSFGFQTVKRHLHHYLIPVTSAAG